MCKFSRSRICFPRRADRYLRTCFQISSSERGFEPSLGYELVKVIDRLRLRIISQYAAARSGRLRTRDAFSYARQFNKIVENLRPWSSQGKRGAAADFRRPLDFRVSGVLSVWGLAHSWSRARRKRHFHSGCRGKEIVAAFVPSAVGTYTSNCPNTWRRTSRHDV
jgi:hypothetical protein